MDDTLTTLIDLVSKGGPLVTVVAVFIAYKAGQTAKSALAAFEQMSKAVVEIRDLIKDGQPEAEKLLALVQEIDKATQSIDIGTVENGDKLSKLLARPAPPLLSA